MNCRELEEPLKSATNVQSSVDETRLSAYVPRRSDGKIRSGRKFGATNAACAV